MEISEKLRQARIQAGLTQDYVVNQLGVSRQTMSNWENGRSCPDIASVLKLSELYGLSLDALLKDSYENKKDEIHFLKKYWYIIYHCAVAASALSILADFLDMPTLAFGLRAAGLLAIFLPRFLFHRLFGGGLKNALIGILGWCIVLFHMYLRFYWDFSYALYWAGHLMVMRFISREYEAKNRTARWIVYGIILAILLFMILSTFSSIGVFSEAAPFDRVYRVEEVLYRADESTDTPIVELASGLSTCYLYLTDDSLDRVQIGEFTYVEPAEGEQETSVKGIWQLVPENDADILYRLTVVTDDSVILSCSVNELLQWKYRLEPVDILTCTVSSGGATTSIRLEWFEDDTFQGDLSLLSKADIREKGNISFTIDVPEVASLPLYEEYYHNGEVESARYTINKDTPLSEFRTRYDSGRQYAIYRIPYENGEFIFCINYS